MRTLEARVAWVTGGARGIGAAIVDALRKRGARVFVTDREPGDGVDRCDARCRTATSSLASSSSGTGGAASSSTGRGPPSPVASS